MTEMTPAEAIYFAAAALPAADQAAYLARACAGQDELKQQVERMLGARAEVGDFLEPASIAAPATNANASFGANSDAPTADYPGKHEHAGAVIGSKYTLVEAIGEGGMGSVWRAKQTEPVKRFVAVKLIKAGMDSKQVLARFEAERQALALMDHPNIAKVLDGGLHDHRPFFVMELVKGVPITDFCDGRKLTPKERLELFVPVCQAIQHAHQKGIIHRDIKPSNVLIALYDDRPVVKVIDFGVAKATGGALTARTIDTGFGAVVGTPQYMSPEQATFNNLDIDTRSDVYALGVLLYELLTGSPPFARKDLEQNGLLEMLRVVREEEPPRPSTRLSTAGALPTLAANRGTEPKALTGLLRNELDWVVMKALEKDRNRRYSSPGNFAEDIERYLRREAILARPPSPAYKLRKFAQRNQAAVLTAAAVAAAVLVGTALATWQAVRAHWAEARALAERDEKEEARAAEAEERERAEANEHKAIAAWAETDKSRRAAEKSVLESTERLVRLNVANGIRLMDEGDSFSALPNLVEALRLLRGDPERERVHRMRIGALLRQCPKLVQVWAGAHPTTHAEFSPDGRRVLIVRDKTVTVHDGETGDALFPPLVHDHAVSIARFSPDGKRLASITGKTGEQNPGAVHLWDALLGTPHCAAIVHPHPVLDVAFHPRDGSLATACADDKIRLWKEGEAKVFRVVKVRQIGTTKWYNTVRFTPDGTRLLVTFFVDSRNEDGVAFWNLANDIVEPSITYNEAAHLRVHSDISPDGRFYWQRCIRDVTTGKALHPENPMGRNPFVAFSSDSQRLVTGDWETGEAQVWECPRGTKLGRPMEHRGPISAVGFSPDGGKVVTASVDGTARIWDARTGKPESPPLLHGGSVTHAQFSANGHLVLTASKDGTVRLWDLANEEPVANRLLVARFANSSAPSSTGRLHLSVENSMAALQDPVEGLRRLPYFAIGGAIETWEFNKDETCFITGTVEGTATVWDVQTGRARFAALAHTKPVSQATFIGDGSRILTIAQYYSETRFYAEQRDENHKLLPQHRGADLRLWDARSGQALTPVMTMPVLAFSTEASPDGALLAAAGGDDGYESGVVYLWNAKTGRLVWSHQLPRPACYVNFSPDGRFLATAEATHEGAGVALRADAAAIWDVATGQQKWAFGHEASITEIRFHPTLPHHLVTASRDRTVRLWNLDTGQPLCIPFMHPDAVQDAAYTADGRFIASATEQGDARLWDPTTGEPVTPWLPRGYQEYSQYWIGGDNTHASALNSIDRAWNTSPAPHTFGDLVTLSNLLAWGTTHGSQGQPRWDAQTFRAAWQQLRVAYPGGFQPSAAAILNWHQREALRYTGAYPGFRRAQDPSRWYAAAWHLDHLLPLLPKPARAWLILRGASRRNLGQVAAALADYTAALDMAPRDEDLLEERAKLLVEAEAYGKAKEDLQRALAILFAEHQQAKAQQGATFRYVAADVLYHSPLYRDLPLLCLKQDDQAGYRRACEQLLEISRQDRDHALLGAIARNCVLSPQGFVDPPRILAIAEAVAAAGGNDAGALRVHGAALFRAGKLDEAAKRLREALAVQAEFPSVWLFLAMTEQRRGRAEEAKKWLEKAGAWIEREQRVEKENWGEHVYLHVLLREARQVLGTMPPSH